MGEGELDPEGSVARVPSLRGQHPFHVWGAGSTRSSGEEEVPLPEFWGFMVNIKCQPNAWLRNEDFSTQSTMGVFPVGSDWPFLSVIRLSQNKVPKASLRLGIVLCHSFVYQVKCPPCLLPEAGTSHGRGCSFLSSILFAGTGHSV